MRCLSTVFLLGFHRFPMVSSQNKGNKTTWQFPHAQQGETHLEPHLIFHLHNYCKPCTRPASLSWPGNAHVYQIATRSLDTKAKLCCLQIRLLSVAFIYSPRCVQFFFFLATAASTATAVSLAIIIKWRMRRTHSVESRRQKEAELVATRTRDAICAPWRLIFKCWPAKQFLKWVSPSASSGSHSHSPHRRKSSRILLLHKM